jgi:hypothetical protein
MEYRVQGVLTSHLHKMGGDAMKNFDFKDLMAFGGFIVALLTLVVVLIINFG